MISASLTLYQADRSQAVFKREAGSSIVQTGVATDTKVMTSSGAQPLDKIAAGARVMTFDAGFQHVLRAHRFEMHAGQSVISVPKGLFGNGSELLLMPDQILVFDAEMAAEAFVEPFTHITAAELNGHWGIKPRNLSQDLRLTQLEFESDEVIWTTIGAMLFCPRPHAVATGLTDLEAA